MRYPPTIVRLLQVLRAHGYTEVRAAEALDLYVVRGTLAASDVLILNAHHGPDRARWIANRWGNAAPVAELAHQLGIGGQQPP